MREIKHIMTCLLLCMALTASAFAADVPESFVSENLNGQQRIVKTYVLPAAGNPEALKEAPFDYDGYHYTWAYTTKEEHPFLLTKSATETVTVEPAEVIIVEGILIFTCKELRDQLNIKIFVDADDDDRVLRIIVRDVAERGRTIDTAIAHYCETVKPMHLQFIEPSKRYADIIVPQGGHNQVAIDVLTTTVEEALEKRSRRRK